MGLTPSPPPSPFLSPPFLSLTFVHDCPSPLFPSCRSFLSSCLGCPYAFVLFLTSRFSLFVGFSSPFSLLLSLPSYLLVPILSFLSLSFHSLSPASSPSLSTLLICPFPPLSPTSSPPPFIHFFHSSFIPSFPSLLALPYSPVLLPSTLSNSSPSLFPLLYDRPFSHSFLQLPHSLTSSLSPFIPYSSNISLPSTLPPYLSHTPHFSSLYPIPLLPRPPIPSSYLPSLPPPPLILLSLPLPFLPPPTPLLSHSLPSPSRNPYPFP